MKKAIYWFRKNLRINDNPSLYNAINENDEVICIYIKNYSIYNPSGIDLGNMGSFRKKFLDESVLDLKNNLKKVGIDLYIFDGDLIKIFKEIKSKYLSNKIYASKEVGWYEEKEEEELKENNFDLILESVGLDATRHQAIKSIAPGGTIVHIGLTQSSGTFNFKKLTIQEVTLVGTYCYTNDDFKRSINILNEKKLGDLGWIEYRDLKKGSEAFKEIHNGTCVSPKIILIP